MIRRLLRDLRYHLLSSLLPYNPRYITHSGKSLIHEVVHLTPVKS